MTSHCDANQGDWVLYAKGAPLSTLSLHAYAIHGDGPFAKLNREDPLLDIARKLEELALQDPYFVDRKLYPNVDFYSGILLRAIGIPTNAFTVCFAIGRLPGWIAHWKEQHEEATSRIIRPRQVYTGNDVTDYVPMERR